MDRQRDEPDSGDATRDSRERLLNGLVGQYVDRINAGEPIDRSRIVLDYPAEAAGSIQPLNLDGRHLGIPKLVDETDLE